VLPSTMSRWEPRWPPFGLVALALAALASEPAAAHPFAGTAIGLTAGFLHPPSGIDHLLAMVSVGIWGAELGAPAIWLLPIIFPLIMAVGGAAGVIGVPLPEGELLIGISVLVLGSLVAAARRVPVWAAVAVVSVFATLSADALAFTIGFVISTGLLHLCGILIGLLGRWPAGVVAIRTGGLLIALTGCYLVYGEVVA
jgi:urease accessory protein